MKQLTGNIVELCRISICDHHPPQTIYQCAMGVSGNPFWIPKPLLEMDDPS